MRLVSALATCLSLLGCHSGSAPDCITKSGLVAYGVQNCGALQAAEDMTVAVLAARVIRVDADGARQWSEHPWAQEMVMAAISDVTLRVQDEECGPGNLGKSNALSREMCLVRADTWLESAFRHEVAHFVDDLGELYEYRARGCDPNDGDLCDHRHPWWESRMIFEATVRLPASEQFYPEAML